MSTLIEVQNAALQLAEKERWQLAESLLESLPPGSACAAEELLHEAETRDQDMESGRVVALDEASFWADIRRKA